MKLFSFLLIVLISSHSISEELTHKDVGNEILKQAKAISFSCKVEGKISGNTLSITIKNCRTNKLGITAMAVNGRVFRNFSIKLRGTKARIFSKFEKVLENYIDNNDLNPSGGLTEVEAISLDISEPDSEGNITGRLEGELKQFVGEIKPITELDKQVLPIMFNMHSYINGKKAMLTDIARTSLLFPKVMERFREFVPVDRYASNPKALKMLVDMIERDWPMSIGAGYASKGVFDALKYYYDRQGPGGLVIHRTSNYNSRWVDSTFEGSWSHKIHVSRKDLGIEYYGIPGSHFYVYRMIPQGSDPADPSNYVVVAPVQFWRQSFSTHVVRDDHVTTNLSFPRIDKYSRDVISVFRSVPSSIGGVSFSINETWGKYSGLLSIKAKKLYGAQKVNCSKRKGLGSFLKRLFGK